MIASLEAELLQVFKEEDRLAGVVKLLERSHAEAIAHLEDRKIDLVRRLDTLKETSVAEQEQQSSMIASIKAELPQALKEEERLVGVVKSLERSHAEALAHFEEEKNDLVRQLDTLKETSVAEHEQQSSKIASLNADLVQVLMEEERLVGVVKSLECSHAEALACSEEVKIDLKRQLDMLKETLVAEQEQQSSKIASLEADLVQALKEEERLGGVVKSLERSHAEALAHSKEVKIDLKCQLHTMEKTSSSEQERLRPAIVSLEADLLQVLQELDYAEEEKKWHRTPITHPDRNRSC